MKISFSKMCTVVHIMIFNINKLSRIIMTVWTRATNPALQTSGKLTFTRHTTHDIKFYFLNLNDI